MNIQSFLKGKLKCYEKLVLEGHYKTTNCNISIGAHTNTIINIAFLSLKFQSL